MNPDSNPFSTHALYIKGFTKADFFSLTFLQTVVQRQSIHVRTIQFLSQFP